MNSNLAGKHVLVTGASRGAGRAIARAFHERGCKVSLFARNEAELAALSQELGERSGYFAGDVSNAADISAALKTFCEKHGQVDVLVNNAGIGAYKAFLERGADELLAEINVNFSGLVLLTHQVASEMASRKAGTIINIASDLGRRPLANMAVYAATKHAVVGFSQSLARELREVSVRCCVICPGIIDTFFGGRSEGDIQGPGALRGDDIARAAIYIAEQPAEVIVDEISIHPLHQDF